MPEEENKKTPDSGDRLDIGGEKKVSVLENVRRMNEKARREEIEAQSRLEAELAEKDRAARDEYAKKLASDRIELMKLKQGLISEDEIPKEETRHKEYSFREKAENFIYHNKIYIIFFGLLTVLAVFLIYDYVTNKKPDASVLIIARNGEFITRAEDMQKVLEPYCEDFNGDGIVYLRVSYLPANTTGETDYYSQADTTQLMVEFQLPDAIMVVTDDFTSDAMELSEGVFADMTEIYPGDPAAFERGYMINGTSLAEDIDFPDFPSGLYMAFRKPGAHLGGSNAKKFNENYANALKVWDNYLKGDPVSADMKHYSDKYAR